MTSSVTGNFPDSLRDWKYQPKFCSERQLPQLASLPPEAATLQDIPWFELPSQSTGFDINARHVRYRHSLWQELKPKVLQGVHTTLVLALPQIGFALAPHIQLEKVFLFLGSMARGLGTVQLFPARYLYPDAHLGGLANMPAPIFADLPAHHGRVAYPCVDCEPDPWRVLAHFGNGDRYYGYPFRAAGDSMQDFTLHDQEDSDRLFLPPSNEADPRIGKRSPLQPSPFPRRTEPVFCLWRPSERSASGKPQLRHGRCHSIQTNARRVTTVGFTSTNRK